MVPPRPLRQRQVVYLVLPQRPLRQLAASLGLPLPQHLVGCLEALLHRLLAVCSEPPPHLLLRAVSLGRHQRRHPAACLVPLHPHQAEGCSVPQRLPLVASLVRRHPNPPAAGFSELLFLPPAGISALRRPPHKLVASLALQCTPQLHLSAVLIP